MTKIDRTKPLPTDNLISLDGAGLMASFVAALEIERERQGMTKTKLAELLGVAQPRVSEWVSGRVTPGIDVIEKWLHALNLRVDLYAAQPAKINPEDLTDDQLAEFHWALTCKSRRVAKSVLSSLLEGNEHATSADVDLVDRHLAKHPRRETIKKMAADLEA